MSGNSKENIQVAKYYLGGILNGLVNVTVRNKRFVPTLAVCVSYNLYKLGEAGSSWLHDGILLPSFWSNSLTTVLKLGLVTFCMANYETIYYILRALPRDLTYIFKDNRLQLKYFLFTIKWISWNLSHL